MRHRYVMGNWKMNGNLNSIHELIQGIHSAKISPNVSCVVFPPFPYLNIVQELLKNSEISLGAQNVFPENSGAFTGEVSGLMLQDVGCKYVLVGHSERRQILAENENLLVKKFHHVKEHDMIPVFCIGETLQEKEQGLTEQVLQKQLSPLLVHADAFANAVIAYEPVWAIGTGHAATPDVIQATHAFIRVWLESQGVHAAKLPLLYGGSVNSQNAKTIFSLPDVDGGLVGGASLNAQQFVEIVECIS